MNPISKVKHFIFFVLIYAFIACKPDKQSNNELVSLLPLLQNSTSVVLNPPPADAANRVISAPNNNGIDFRNQNNAIDGVRGGGLYVGGTNIFSLAATGTGAAMVLDWNGKTILNGTGIDFVIFENPFRIQGTANYFIEPLIVEVSQDNLNYCGFLPDYVNSDETVFSPTQAKWLHFAGINPVFYHEENNRLTGGDIYNSSIAGGDSFDLDNLSSDNTFNIGCSASLVTSIQTNGFVYIRLISATARINPDTGVAFVKNPYADSYGSDIDGVFARYRQ